MSCLRPVTGSGLLLALAISVLRIPTVAHAYTPNQQQACSNDAFRLCGPYIPDVDRVTACMIRSKSKLSPDCRAQFRSSGRTTSARPARARRPVHILPRKHRKPKRPHTNHR